MSGHRSGRPSYLVYCLLAVILFGCYLLLTGFQDDNSTTMAPNLTVRLCENAPEPSALRIVFSIARCHMHWKTGDYGRIFREWKQQLSSAGAALNISASNQCA